MAFVFRSSKNLEERLKAQNNIYPLNNPDINNVPEITKKYFSHNNNIKSMAPFGVKALKESSYHKDNSNSPGPGSYQLTDNFLKKSFNQNLTSPFDPENIEGTPSQLFISKERRFRYMYNTDNNNQSPTDYSYEKNKFSKYSEKKTYSQYPKPKIYKAFDPNRKISIPSDDFYFEINNNDEVEVRQNIKNMNKNWNNTGPGSYDAKFIMKNNKSIDWSRTVNDIKKNKNKGNEKFIEDKDLKINTQIHTFNKSNISESSYNNAGNNSTNAMNTNIVKLANKICNTDLINNTDEGKKKKDKLDLKIEDIPGPGDYDISPFINTPICFSNVTNFGSNASRGLLYPKKDNKILIGHKDRKLIPIIKNNNKKYEHNKSLSLENKNYDISNKYNKHNKKGNKLNPLYDSYELNSMYVNNLKERNLINKKIIKTQIGPGSYDPSYSFYKYKKDNDIQNFGVLDIRFKEDNEKMNNPGVGTYSLQGDLIKKKYTILSPVPPNIVKRNSEGISNSKFQAMKMYLYSERNKQPGVGDYSPELVNSLNYQIYKEAKNSEKKPGFNSEEKRFFEPKNKYEDENQVGKYNILPKEKEFGQQISPFGSRTDRYKYDEESGKKNNVGPGAYRYDSYFDWNKKSYNMLFNV